MWTEQFFSEQSFTQVRYIIMQLSGKFWLRNDTKNCFKYLPFWVIFNLYMCIVQFVLYGSEREWRHELSFYKVVQLHKPCIHRVIAVVKSCGFFDHSLDKWVWHSHNIPWTNSLRISKATCYSVMFSLILHKLIGTFMADECSIVRSAATYTHTNNNFFESNKICRRS